MKKLLSLFLVLALAFSLCVGALAEETAAKAENDLAGKIVILHTNDVHGNYDQGVTYAGLAGLKDELLKSTDYVTLVDSGDFSQGSTMATLSSGEYIIQLMNAVGYDFVVPGNHEFDYGMTKALENLNALDATVLSCNFIDLKTQKPVFDGYKVVSYGDTKVAFVGVCTPETYTKSTPTYFQDTNGNYIYSFCEDKLYATVQASVDAAIAEGADYVVAIGHMGIDASSGDFTSRNLIANTTGIDVFIDGHSHSVINGETVKNKAGKDVILNQTGTKLANVGEIVIDPAAGTITAGLVDKVDSTNKTVADLAASIEAEYKDYTSQVVAKSEVKLVATNDDGSWAVRNSETNLGDLVADAYRIVMGADIGLMNGGGIRADIAAGDVTIEDILNVMTFGNMATVVKATGQQILDCLEMGASAYPGLTGGFTHVSGLTYTIDPSIPSSVKTDAQGNFSSVDGEYRVKDVKVGGEALDLNKVYTVACHSYWLTSYGDGMTMFKGAEIVSEKHEIYVDNEMLLKYITENLKGVITAEQYGKSQGRITIKEADTGVFTDVVEGKWYYDAVMTAYEKELMNGVTDKTFEPLTAMNRAMLVTMLYRLEGSPAVEGKVSEVFADCKDGSYYADAVLWASQNKIVSGRGESAFAPLATMTRQEMAVILYNYSVFKGAAEVTEPELTYADAESVASWAAAAVDYCTDAKLMNGVTDTTFDPAGSANRAMGATVLVRLMEAAA